MTGWLTALGPEGTALALLVLGHVLGDFAFQTDALARTKHRVRPLGTHGLIVLVVHLAVFLPLLTPRTGLLVVAVAVSHVLVDAVTARVRNRPGTSARLFLGDQLVHLLVLLGAWSLIGPHAWTDAPVVAALGGENSVPWIELTTGAVYLSAFVFAHEGGTPSSGASSRPTAPSPRTTISRRAPSSARWNGGSSSCWGWAGCGKRSGSSWRPSRSPGSRN
jgi:hypothetical protein